MRGKDKLGEPPLPPPFPQNKQILHKKGGGVPQKLRRWAAVSNGGVTHRHLVAEPGSSCRIAWRGIPRNVISIPISAPAVVATLFRYVERMLKLCTAEIIGLSSSLPVPKTPERREREHARSRRGRHDGPVPAHPVSANIGE